jgi:hypothetical protein
MMSSLLALCFLAFDLLMDLVQEERKRNYQFWKERMEMEKKGKHNAKLMRLPPLQDKIDNSGALNVE